MVKNSFFFAVWKFKRENNRNEQTTRTTTKTTEKNVTFRAKCHQWHSKNRTRFLVFSVIVLTRHRCDSETTQFMITFRMAKFAIPSICNCFASKQMTLTVAMENATRFLFQSILRLWRTSFGASFQFHTNRQEYRLCCELQPNSIVPHWMNQRIHQNRFAPDSRPDDFGAVIFRLKPGDRGRIQFTWEFFKNSSSWPSLSSLSAIDRETESAKSKHCPGWRTINDWVGNNLISKIDMNRNAPPSSGSRFSTIVSIIRFNCVPSRRSPAWPFDALQPPWIPSDRAAYIWMRRCQRNALDKWLVRRRLSAFYLNWNWNW